MKIGSVVQLNQGDTKSNWVVTGVHNAMVDVVHEDELSCAPHTAFASMFHQSDINKRDRDFLLTAFADTKRGKEIVKALTQ